MSDHSPNEFVIASSVRTGIVTQLADGPAPIDELLSEIDATSSAVYDAVSTLADRGLLTETSDGWKLSARGLLVADAIDQWQSTERFLNGDPEYWKHTTSV